MNAFHVWLRPLGDLCRVRVDGVENAKWLLERLSESVDVRISDSFGEKEGPSGCTFEVPYNPLLSRSGFEQLLAVIPEVNLMTGPEGKAAARRVRPCESSTGS